MTVTLRPFERGDFDRLISWIATPEALSEWAGGFFAGPLDDARLARYLEGADDPEARRRIFTAMADDRAIGHIELSHIWPRLSGRLSRALIGDPRERGKGLGTAMVRALATLAFADYAFDRIDLGVSDRNGAAIACYQRAGFRHVGTWTEGMETAAGTIDVYWMTLARTDFDAQTGDRK